MVVFCICIRIRKTLVFLISFDEQGHSIARKKYYMAVAEDMAKSINLEQEEKQAELIDAIIRERFPEEGVEQDMGAACILMNPANPKEAWKQMMRDVTDSINARLGGIVKNLEEGMSRGVHHYYSEESGYSVKRMSDNDAWYGEFYKQHKRRPNKAELLEMAREVYKGGGDKYGMPEHTFEATEEMQEDFDALDQDFANMEVLEDIKEKIDTLPASEMAIMRGLTPSGYKVYQQARKQFESGNTDVQKAGRMNAILLARYAERMADNISKITGQEYTAEDYMRERIGIVPNASDAENGMYGQPITNLDLDLDREVDVLDLDAMGNALKGKSPKEVLAYIKEISDGVQVPTADFKAMVGLPKNIDAYGQRHIVFNRGGWKKRNVIARDKLLENFFKVIFATRVVEISPNKKIKEENLTKTQKRKNEVSRFYRLFVPVKMNGHLYTLLITAEDFNKNVEIDAQEVSLYEISAKKIEANRLLGSPESDDSGSAGTLPFKISIREVLQVVKDVDGNPYINSDGSGNFAVYNQTAYHGSPHKFDKFDLGAIGSGEGAQAHGWGLYFAQDRKVSERYQETLARKNRNKGVILYDGKEDAEVSNAMRYYGSAGLYSALSKESRDAVKAQKEISNILVGMHNDIERWDKQVKFYQKHIDRIKENPKLSITAFLKEAPKEDVSKLKDIVDDAKSFARMSGKRTNIKGVLDRLQTKQEMPLNEKDFLTRYANILENLDVDKLEIDIPTGSLFEVDIPENDVLLDEDKTLSEQPEKVRQAILEYYRQRPEDYIVPESENDLGTQTGKVFYKDVVFQMRREGHEESPERAASELLNELGIKGITYEGYRDGRCYVVFDDKAISIIERYNQSAAMRKQSFATMKDFADAIEKDRGAVTKLGNWIQTDGGSEFVIAGSSYLHIQNGAHPLTTEQWQVLVDNIDNRENAESITFFDNQKGSFGGVPVGVKIKTPLGKAGAILEFLPSGKVFLVTAVFNNDKALDNWIKNKKNSHTLEIGDMMSQNRIMGSSFIDIIQSELGIVNKVHLQSAAMRKENKSYVTNSQGSVDWGYVNETVADDGTQIKKAPIRMQIGYQVGDNVAGNGYAHIVKRHSDFVDAQGYKSIEDAVYDVLNNVSFVVSLDTNKGQRLLLVKDQSPNTSIMLSVDYIVDEDGEYYSVNNLLPSAKGKTRQNRKKALLFSGRQSPEPITGDGAVFTLARSISAGTPRGSMPRKSSAFDIISISEVEKYVKKFTYSDGVEQRSVASMVRGQTRISGMSRVVSLFESADKSTFVHELGHVALADLKMLAEMDNAPQQLVRDWQTVKEWLGYKDSQGFTREQHERFARGFEAYLRTGEAPVRGLKAVFRTFKKWLCDIYADFI